MPRLKKLADKDAAFEAELKKQESFWEDSGAADVAEGGSAKRRRRQKKTLDDNEDDEIDDFLKAMEEVDKENSGVDAFQEALQQVQKQQSGLSSLGDSDAESVGGDAASKPKGRIAKRTRRQKAGPKTRVRVGEEGDDEAKPTTGLAALGDSDAESEGGAARFRPLRQTGAAGKRKAQEDNELSEPEEDQVEAWEKELGWTPGGLRPDAEVDRQAESSLRRSAFSIQLKTDALRRLDADCFLGKKMPSSGGLPLLDDEKKINLHFLLGTHRDLNKGDARNKDIVRLDQKRVRWLVREGIRLKIISKGESSRGRIGANRVKDAKSFKYELNHAGLQHPSDDEGNQDRERLAPGMATKAMQDLRFPSRKKIPARDAADSQQASDRQNLFGSEDEDDKERKAKRQRSALELKQKAKERGSQMLTAKSDQVDLGEVAERMMAPTLSFDWEQNDLEGDDFLEVTVPEDKPGEKSRRELMQESLKKQTLALKAKRLHSTAAVAMKRSASSSALSKSMSSDTLGSAQDVAISEGVAGLASRRHRVVDDVKAGQSDAAISAPTTATDPVSAPSSAPAQTLPRSETMLQEVSATTDGCTNVQASASKAMGTSATDNSGPSDSVGPPCDESAFDHSQKGEVQAEPAISPTAPWIGTAAPIGAALDVISPTAPWSGAESERTSEDVLPPTAPWHGTAPESSRDPVAKQSPLKAMFQKQAQKAEVAAHTQDLSPTARWGPVASNSQGEQDPETKMQWVPNSAGGVSSSQPEGAQPVNALPATVPWEPPAELSRSKSPAVISPTAPWQGDDAVGAQSPLPLSATAPWDRRDDDVRTTAAALSPTAMWGGGVEASERGSASRAESFEDSRYIEEERIEGLLASPVLVNTGSAKQREEDEEGEDVAASASNPAEGESSTRAGLDDYVRRERGPQKKQATIFSILKRGASTSGSTGAEKSSDEPAGGDATSSTATNNVAPVTAATSAHEEDIPPQTPTAVRSSVTAPAVEPTPKLKVQRGKEQEQQDDDGKVVDEEIEDEGLMHIRLHQQWEEEQEEKFEQQIKALGKKSTRRVEETFSQDADGLLHGGLQSDEGEPDSEDDEGNKRVLSRLRRVADIPSDHSRESESEVESDDEEILEEKRRQLVQHEKEWMRHARRKEKKERARLQTEVGRAEQHQNRITRELSFGTATMSAEERRRWETAIDVTGVQGFKKQPAHELPGATLESVLKVPAAERSSSIATPMRKTLYNSRAAPGTGEDLDGHLFVDGARGASKPKVGLFAGKKR